jgi:hypothetical protein
MQQQSPSGEGNRLRTSQEIPLNLWKPKVHYRIHKSPPPGPILNQINISFPSSKYPYQISLPVFVIPFVTFFLSPSHFILNIFAHISPLIEVYHICLHFYHCSEFSPLSAFVIDVKIILQSNSDIAPLFFSLLFVTLYRGWQ